MVPLSSALSVLLLPSISPPSGLPRLSAFERRGFRAALWNLPSRKEKNDSNPLCFARAGSTGDCRSAGVAGVVGENGGVAGRSSSELSLVIRWLAPLWELIPTQMPFTHRGSALLVRKTWP